MVGWLMTMSDEFEELSREAVLAYFKVLTRHSPGCSEDHSFAIYLKRYFAFSYSTILSVLT
jgi:hypothetical protein